MKKIQIAVFDYTAGDVDFYTLELLPGIEQGEQIEDFLYGDSDRGGADYSPDNTHYMTAGNITINDMRNEVKKPVNND